MSNVIQVVLSNARHPEYGQFTIPFPIPQDAYDDMVEALKNMEIGDPILQDCHVDELESSYSILKRLEKTNLNLDELDYLAKRLDSFDNGEAAQFQGMACKLGVSNIKDFINLTFCCQQATVITDFSDLDAIGRQHYMTMQGGGCRTEELERLDSQKFALDLILNHTEGSITPYGVVYDNGMKLEPLYDGRHFPCYHYQQDLLAVGLSSGQRPENTGQITWLLLPCSEQQLNLIMASQNLEDFDREGIRELTKPLFAIPPHQFIFNCGSIDKRFYMDLLQLEEAEYNLIRFPQRGVCLFKCGNERYLLEVHAPTYKEALFGSAGGR